MRFFITITALVTAGTEQPTTSSLSLSLSLKKPSVTPLESLSDTKPGPLCPPAPTSNLTPLLWLTLVVTVLLQMIELRRFYVLTTSINATDTTHCCWFAEASSANILLRLGALQMLDCVMSHRCPYSVFTCLCLQRRCAHALQLPLLLPINYSFCLGRRRN